MRTLVLSLLIAFSARAEASNIPTFAYFVANSPLVEAYLIQCTEPGAAATMTCKIMDILVSPNVDKSKAEERRRQAEADAKNLLADQRGLTQMCSVQSAVSDMAQRANSIAAAKHFAALYRDLCTTRSLPAARRFALGLVEHDEKTCVIGTGGGWETTFSQRGPHTWVANNGPDGICGRITIETLDEDPTHPRTWRYTVHKVTTAVSNNTLCEKFTNTTQTYDWSVQEKPMACEFIKFGLPGT
jgi:hypothetical protein